MHCHGAPGGVETVHLAVEHDITRLLVHRPGAHRIQVRNTIQAGNADLPDVPNGQVSMQRTGEVDPGGAGVRHLQAELQGGAEPHIQFEMEGMIPAAAGFGVIGQGELQGDSRLIRGDRPLLPEARPHQSVGGQGGIIRMAAKPRPAERHPAADGFALLIERFRTEI